MLVGYARVSTAEQTLALQEDALRAAGCARIFTDTISGAKAERRGLSAALAYLRPGDALAVWRLDRLGRSLPALIATLTDLEERGIGFRSLTEQLDTTTSGGKLIFHVFGALAEFERDLIRECTRAGPPRRAAEEAGHPDQGGAGAGALRRQTPLGRRDLPDARHLARHALSRCRGHAGGRGRNQVRSAAARPRLRPRTPWSRRAARHRSPVNTVPQGARGRLSPGHPPAAGVRQARQRCARDADAHPLLKAAPRRVRRGGVGQARHLVEVLAARRRRH